MTNPNCLTSIPGPISACPSCASQSVSVLELGVDAWVASCSNCGLLGPISAGQDQAVDGWNLRLAPAKNSGSVRQALQNI
ncbi:MAG: hypothetical protein M0Z99_26410 [Betaproteobacteria bacterium]|nr:hypothetical protein [Betaproteobacteria bacterium]